MTRPTNILLFHVDQMRQDIAYHTARETYAGVLPEVSLPNLDRLRAEGVPARHACCQFPICGPSRASFITGKYPRQLGAYNNACNIPVHEPTLAHRVAPHGYQCVALGRTHRQHRGFHKWPEDHSEASYGHRSVGSRLPSDEVVGVYEHPIGQQHDRQTVDQFERFLNGRDASQPFCVMLGLMTPHPPFYPPRAFAGRYSPDDITLPELPENHWRAKPRMQRIPAEKGWLCHDVDVRKRIAAAYLDLCTYMDDCVGRAIASLEAAGELDNTVVAFFADHGEQLGEHEMLGKFHNVYEGSLRTPLVLRLPDTAHAGQEIDALVELVDVVPTVMDYAGLDVPDGLPGRSLRGVIEQPDAGHRDAVHAMIENGEMIRTDRWKLAIYHDDAIDGELYDLHADPGERHNLFTEPDHATVRDDLAARIVRHMMRYHPAPSRAAHKSHTGSPDPVPPPVYPTVAGGHASTEAH